MYYLSRSSGNNHPFINEMTSDPKKATADLTQKSCFHRNTIEMQQASHLLHELLLFSIDIQIANIIKTVQPNASPNEQLKAFYGSTILHNCGESSIILYAPETRKIAQP